MFKKLARFVKRNPETAQKAGRWLRVYMDTNWSCNIGCRICLHSVIDRAFIRHGSMSLELFSKIARNVFPITQHLSLSCSAEPLLSGMFVDVLKNIGEYNVPFVEFITNATLLNDKNIDAIISSGIDLMIVSLDSADKDVFEKIRVGAKFEKVISNLEKFQKAKKERGVTRPELSVSAVLMRSTIEGLEDLMLLAHRLGAEGINFRHLIPYAPLHLKEESLFYHKELANEHIFRARALADKLNFKTFHLPDIFSEDANPPDATIDCRLPWEVIFIRANGNVVPCESQLSIVMGNLVEQSFDEVWNSPAYVKLREELTTGNYRKACIQCPAVVSSRTSDPMAFQEIPLPAFNDLLRLFTERVPFSEDLAMLCNKSLAQYYIIKPEYDLTTGDGVTPEKIERWEKWYAKTLQIHDGFKAGSF